MSPASTMRPLRSSPSSVTRCAVCASMDSKKAPARGCSSHAGRLIKEGITPRRACHVAVTWGITDDAQVQQSLDEVVAAIFP